jgi:hypothetical protein
VVPKAKRASRGLIDPECAVPSPLQEGGGERKARNLAMTSDTIFREYRISDDERRLYNVLFASDLAGKRLTMKSPVQNKPNFPPVSLWIHDRGCRNWSI